MIQRGQRTKSKIKIRPHPPYRDPTTIKETGVSRKEFEAKVKQMSEIAFEDQCVGANPSYPLVEDLTRVFWESYGESPP